MDVQDTAKQWARQVVDKVQKETKSARNEALITDHVYKALLCEELIRTVLRQVDSTLAKYEGLAAVAEAARLAFARARLGGGYGGYGQGPWKCKKSPTGYCLYDQEDPGICVCCGDLRERK